VGGGAEVGAEEPGSLVVAGGNRMGADVGAEVPLLGAEVSQPAGIRTRSSPTTVTCGSLAKWVCQSNIRAFGPLRLA